MAFLALIRETVHVTITNRLPVSVIIPFKQSECVLKNVGTFMLRSAVYDFFTPVLVFKTISLYAIDFSFF